MRRNHNYISRGGTFECLRHFTYLHKSHAQWIEVKLKQCSIFGRLTLVKHSSQEPFEFNVTFCSRFLVCSLFVADIGAENIFEH